MITVFVTPGKPTLLDVLPKSSKFNQFCFMNYFFEFENGKTEFLPSDATIDFWVHIDDFPEPTNCIQQKGDKIYCHAGSFE
jgi:hypothetical protein